jgi:S1-C subfamily serine protease
MVSVLAIAAMGIAVGSGAVIFGTNLPHRHTGSRPEASPSAASSSPAPMPAAASQLLEAVAAADLPEVVTVVAVGPTSEELGTGWPVDDTGDFLTNDHVVHDGQSFHILLPSGLQYSAEVINDDPAWDLAEIHVWGFEEAAFPIEDSLPPVGEPVVVLAAQGATGHPPVTVSEVGALDQSATVPDAAPGEVSNYTGLMRIGGQVFPGNSGGPVLTPRGQVVGILTLAAETGANAFAIPITHIDQVIQSWLSG